MSINRTVLLLVVAFNLMVPVGVADSAAGSQVLQARFPGWKVLSSSHGCSLLNTNGAADRFSVELEDSLSEPSVFIIRPTSGSVRPVPVRVVLQPSGKTYAPQDGNALRLPGGFILPKVSVGFLDDLSVSDRLELYLYGKKRVELSLTPGASAISAVRECHKKLFRTWGVDQSSLYSLSRQPVSIRPTEWYDDEETRKIVQKIRKGGDTIARITISSEGRVKDCATVASSSSPILDNYACTTLLKRGRFEPGLDREGVPVQVTIPWLVRWIIIEG